MSLVEARRVNGTVGQRHIASLGAVTLERRADYAWVTVRERREIWQQLHEQLGRLGLDGGTAGKLMTALQARAPYPTVEETGAAELAEAERDVALWESMHGTTLKQIETCQKLIAAAESWIAEERALGKYETERAEQAKAKAARLANYRGAADGACPAPGQKPGLDAPDGPEGGLQHHLFEAPPQVVDLP